MESSTIYLIINALYKDYSEATASVLANELFKVLGIKGCL